MELLIGACWRRAARGARSFRCRGSAPSCRLPSWANCARTAALSVPGAGQGAAASSIFDSEFPPWLPRPPPAFVGVMRVRPQQFFERFSVDQVLEAHEGGRVPDDKDARPRPPKGQIFEESADTANGLSPALATRIARLDVGVPL